MLATYSAVGTSSPYGGTDADWLSLQRTYDSALYTLRTARAPGGVTPTVDPLRVEEPDMVFTLEETTITPGRRRDPVSETAQRASDLAAQRTGGAAAPSGKQPGAASLLPSIQAAGVGVNIAARLQSALRRLNPPNLPVYRRPWFIPVVLVAVAGGGYVFVTKTKAGRKLRKRIGV